MPSANEFTILEAIVEVFKPLSVCTDALSGEDHVTITAVRPLLHHLLENVLKVESGSNGLISELKLSISRNLPKRYEAPEVIEVFIFRSKVQGGMTFNIRSPSHSLERRASAFCRGDFYCPRGRE